MVFLFWVQVKANHDSEVLVSGVWENITSRGKGQTAMGSHMHTWLSLPFLLLHETGPLNRAAHLGQVFRLINTTFTEIRKVLPHLGKPSLSHLSQIILNLSSWQLKVIITCTLIQVCQILEFTKRQNPKDFLSLYSSLDTTCLSLFVTKRRF